MKLHELAEEQALAPVSRSDAKSRRARAPEEVEPVHGDGSTPAAGRAAEASPGRASAARWRIIQRCDDVDVARANRQAIEDVGQGATGLALVFEGAPNAFGFGLPDQPGTLTRVLDGVPLDRIELRVDAHPSSRAMADRLVAFFGRAKVDPAKLRVSFGIDSAAVFASTGRLRMSIEALEASMPQSLAHFFAMGVPGVLLEADGRVFHNAGASEAQELGIMLAGGVAHLRLFEDARQALIYAAPYIGFALSVDQDQLAGIAKIRALRHLWKRVQDAVSTRSASATIHAETSYRMMTLHDQETNIVRATLAAQAAALGGADSISILPHTLPHGLPDAAARRVSRSAQLVLAHESPSGLDGTADAGIDALAERLCEEGWAEFQRISKEGGLLRSLATGNLQARIVEARQARMARLAAGRITGIFGEPGGAPPITLDAARRPLPTDGTIFCQRLPSERLDEMLTAGR